MLKTRSKVCCVEGCGKPCYHPPSNAHFRYCLEHVVARKREQRARLKQGLSNGRPGQPSHRTEVPDDGGYRPQLDTGLKGLRTPGFGL